MAKTLVALYDTFTTAEHVVQELIPDGFARSDMHLALDHTEGCDRLNTRLRRVGLRL